MILFNDVKKFKSYICIHNEQKFTRGYNTTTDSRKVQSGDAFLALRGERINAFDLIEDVISRGASLIVYEHVDEQVQLINQYTTKYPKVIFVGVKNTTHFLQELAHDHRMKFEGIVVGISGSNGKTTTKEMLFHILNELNPNEVVRTQANNNNHIGVPLTLLSINPKLHKFAVVELGSNHPGEMNVVSEILTPDFVLVTNIGETHLEFFNGIQGVLVEEMQSTQHLNKAGIFFRNCADQLINEYPAVNNEITFGSAYSDFPFEVSTSEINLKDNKHDYIIKNKNITGAHNFWNLAISVLIAKFISKMDMSLIISAAANFKPTQNRSEWREVDGVKVFLDAYNANPSSMLVSLAGFFDQCKVGDRTLVVLGDMNELGAHAEVGHLKVANEVARHKPLQCTYIGRFYPFFIKGYGHAKHYANVDSYIGDFRSSLKGFDRVFIKGSRSLQLERLLDIK